MTPGQLAEANRRIAEAKYRRALARMIRDIRLAIAGLTTPQAIILAVQTYAASKAFAALIDLAVGRLVTATQVGQRSTWRAAVAASTRGREIYQALTQELAGTPVGGAMASIITQNANLIKTVPQQLAARFSSYAAQQAIKGVRPADIAKQMQKQAPYLADVQVTRIARTESAKAQSALMEARCQALDIRMYQWYSCQDERVRDAHRLMHGVYCLWSDPPDPEALAGEKSSGHPYHPGGIYNCRCIALPVIFEADIAFPARVHVGGKIIRVSSLKTLHAALAA